MIAVARHSALVAGIMAGFLLVAALVALLRGEVGADVFLMTALLTVFGAGAVYLSVRNRGGRLTRLASYSFIVLLWVGLPLIAAFPIAATTPLSPLEAWLEAVSAFTTTGAVQIHSFEDTPRATLAWLLTLQWGGGLLTLIGTSTNLLVNDMARNAGQPAFSLFEITPVGLTVAGAGALYLYLVGTRLLPKEEATVISQVNRAKSRWKRKK